MATNNDSGARKRLHAYKHRLARIERELDLLARGAAETWGERRDLERQARDLRIHIRIAELPGAAGGLS